MSEKTTFIQCVLPPLVAGRYAVAVEQQVWKDGKDVTTELRPDGIKKSFEFGVDAARFTLNPNDIYSVYPPAGQAGKFSESLPHIVFTRRTLPWERTLDGSASALQKNLADNPPVPWMAVLLFDEEELKGLKLEKRTIRDLIKPVEKKVIGPRIFDSQQAGVPKLMDWEDGKNLDNGCTLIDISKEQFEKQVPSKISLAYLAHAKEVGIQNKDKNGIKDMNEKGTGVFSVLVGNRIPRHGKQHLALVVSLEGFQDYLAEDGRPALQTIPAEHKVRLAVLANWNFTDSNKAGFYALLHGLEIKTMRIKRAGTDKVLEPYFDFGYTPLEHRTRAGATTLSWYHGPFLPAQAPKSSRTISFSSPDAALRFDTATGFFDVSFAAAWQLGRMLALQNQGFSKAMLNWRIQRRQRDAAKQRQATVLSLLQKSGTSAQQAKTTPLKSQVIGYLADLAGITLKPAGDTEAVADSETDPNLDDIPPDVSNFLGDLYRLRGVPFPYLVPHEYLLEKQRDENSGDAKLTGTLSFFYVDPNWIEALMDGALSIGRMQKMDWIIDKAISGVFSQDLGEKSGAGGLPAHPTKNLNVTGFLLRSDLVSGWRGLDIKAYDEKKALLPSLRFERIDDDIFLGIFHGNVSSIEITQPYEGLHFSLNRPDEKLDVYRKAVKSETDGTIGTEKDLPKDLTKDGIVDVAGLAKWLSSNGASKARHFTSAEFAYQMVDVPIKYTINVQMKVN